MRRVVLAGLLARIAARDHPRRAAGRAGRRQSTRPAAAAGGPAPQRGPDGRGDLARLLRAWRSCAPARCTCTTAHRAARADRGWRHVMTAPAATKQRGPVVLLRPVPGDTVIHRLWAGTKLIVGGGHRRAADVLPGLGADRRWWPLLVLTTAWLAHVSARRVAVDSAVAVGPGVAGRRDGHLRRRQPRSSTSGSVNVGTRWAADLPAHHGAVDRAARARRDGVVDHQRRRNRARRSQIGPPAAALRIPVDDWAVRWRWRCARS